LKEGDKVVTAQLNTPTTASSPATNPFGGSGRRF
jgi:hypothetical protein